MISCTSNLGPNLSKFFLAPKRSLDVTPRYALVAQASIKSLKGCFGYCHHPVTVYIRGHIKGYIEISNHNIDIAQLLQSGGSALVPKFSKNQGQPAAPEGTSSVCDG